jgi:hypothetical protein
MNNIPKTAKLLMRIFAGTFTRSIYPRFAIVLPAAILTTERCTVTNLAAEDRGVRTYPLMVELTYHGVLSKRRWRTWRMAFAMTGYIPTHWVCQPR